MFEWSNTGNLDVKKPRYKEGNPFWNFFYDNDFYAICKECSESVCRGLKKNTTNMATHLKNNHPKLHEELVELRQMARNPLPPPVTVVNEAVGADKENPIAGMAKFLKEVATAVANDVKEKTQEQKEPRKSGNPEEDVIDIEDSEENEKHEDELFDASDDYVDTNMDNIPPSITWHSPRSNTQQSLQETNSTKPNVSMSEEELRKRLLIAQIEREEAATRNLQTCVCACTAALHSRFTS